MAAVAVGAGRYFSVAATASGHVFAWGRCRCGRPLRDASSPGGNPAGSPGGDPAETLVETAPRSREGRRRRGGGQAGTEADDGVEARTPYVVRGGGLEAEHVVQLAVGYAHVLMLTAEGSLFSCESGDDGYGGRLSTAPLADSFGQLGELEPSGGNLGNRRSPCPLLAPTFPSVAAEESCVLSRRPYALPQAATAHRTCRGACSRRAWERCRP